MSEPNHKYVKKVAKAIVENAILFGMPVPKVEVMYEFAKKSAGDAVSKKAYTNPMARTTAFFTLLQHFFKAGLKKYSAKMSEFDRMEVRAVLTRNRDKLIEGLTKNDDSAPAGGKSPGQEGK